MINLFSIHKFFTDAFTFYSGPSGGGTSMSYTSNVPKGMEGDARNLFNMMQQQQLNIDENGNIVGFKPYVPYSANPADYVAGFSPMQEQSFTGAANLQVPGQYGQATDLAGAAGMGGINSAQQAYDYGAQGAQSGMMGQNVGLTGGQAYGNMGAQYGAQGAGYGDIAAQIGQMGLQAQQTGQGITQQSQDLAAQQAAAGDIYQQMAINPNAVQAYMSPYQQAVTQQAVDAAYRNADIQRTGRQATAAKAGAFGGSRQAIENAEAERALNTQIQNIEAQGLQSAYDKAIQSMQYGTSLGVQGLGGAQSGLGTALQGGQLGLSGIGTALQGLQGGMQGSGLGMQGAGIGLQGVNAQLAGTGQGMQGAQAGLQGVSGAQAGYSLANQAGSNLANIGTQQNQAAQSILDQQNRFGAQQQQQQQNITNQAIQNYAMAQENPNMIAQNLSNMIRGTQGQGTSTTNYAANPSLAGTAANAALAYTGAKAAGVFGAAEGGIVKLAQGGMIKGYAEGGVTGIDNVERIAGKLSIQQLQQAMQNKTVPEYVGIPLLQMKTQEAQAAAAQQQAQAQQGGQPPSIKDQIMQQAQQAEGMQGIEGLPSNLPTEEMADGGIVAFADNRDQPVRVGMPGSSDYMQLTPEQFNRLLPAEKLKYIQQYGTPPSAAAARNAPNAGGIYERAVRADSLFPNMFPASSPDALVESRVPTSIKKEAEGIAQARSNPLTAERIQMPELPSLGGMSPGRTPKFDFKPEEYDTTAQQAILARQQNPDTGKFYTEDELTAKEEAKRTKAGITDIYTPERDRLEKELGGLEGKKKEAWGLALMQGAFESMAKGDPNLARSLGLVGSGTMKAITPALKEIKDSEKDMRKQQFSMNALQQQYKQAVLSGDQAKIDKYQAKLDNVETNLEAARNKNIEARNSVGLAAEKAEFDYTKDMGLTAMRESGANARANATNQLYYAGLKGGTGSPKGSFTADQINQMYEDFGPQADQMLAPELAKYGKAQLKTPEVINAINARREEIIQGLINKRMNMVGGMRSGVGSNTIDYSALQSLYPK